MPDRIVAANASAWSDYTARCVERRLPGILPPAEEGGPKRDAVIFIHAFTARDAAELRRRADAMNNDWGPGPDGKPSKLAPSQEVVAVAKLTTVCRTAPGSAERTFVVEAGRENAAYREISTHLSWSVVQSICAEADLLGLDGYMPAGGQGDGGGRSLDEAIATDQAFYASLEHLSLSLFGVPLTANDAPIGSVLRVLQHDNDLRNKLTETVASLAAAAGAGGAG